MGCNGFYHEFHSIWERMADERDESGKFTAEYPKEAFIAAIEKLDVPGTKNIADEVGCSYDLAYLRLKELEEAGEVQSDEVGQAFIWTSRDK